MRYTLWKCTKNEYGFAVTKPECVGAVEIPNGTAKPGVIVHELVAYVPSNHPSRYIETTLYLPGKGTVLPPPAKQ